MLVVVIVESNELEYESLIQRTESDPINGPESLRMNQSTMEPYKIC